MHLSCIHLYKFIYISPHAVCLAAAPADCTLSDTDKLTTDGCKCTATSTTNDCAKDKYCWADKTCSDTAKPGNRERPFPFLSPPFPASPFLIPSLYMHWYISSLPIYVCICMCAYTLNHRARIALDGCIWSAFTLNERIWSIYTLNLRAFVFTCILNLCMRQGSFPTAMDNPHRFVLPAKTR